jgi:glycosyltransferase involved in cell wall biosynthesis
MEPLSVAIITFNEAHRIEACLAAIQYLADEIVILDSGSTDATLALAQKFGAICYTHPFDGHIEQKNRILNFTRHALVLSLDADEVVDAHLAKAIMAVKMNRQADAYMVQRLNHYGQQPIYHGGWFPDKKYRLWLKNSGRWGGQNPHDTFELLPGVKTALLPGFLHHYSFPNAQAHGEKSKKYAAIAAQAYLLAGKKTFVGQGILHGVSRWMRDFIWRRGFLDGKAGWDIAAITFKEIVMKYAILREKQKLRS